MNEKAATAKKRLLSLDANLISPFDNTLQTIAFGYLACAIVYRIPSRAVRFAIPAANALAKGLPAAKAMVPVPFEG